MFNNKKIKKLKEDIKKCQDLCQIQSEENLSLSNQNEKLVEWVQAILKEFGTTPVREPHVTIPVIRNDDIEETMNLYAGDIDKPYYKYDFKTTCIHIPSITIYKRVNNKER